MNNYPDYKIVNADKLTYAGNLNNLRDVESSKNYRFEKLDIVDKNSVSELFNSYSFDAVIHLAAATGSADREPHFRVNARGPEALLDQASRAGDSNAQGRQPSGNVSRLQSSSNDGFSAKLS